MLAIERVLEKNSLNMEIIVNNKTFSNGLNIIQLETAVGAAMKSFEGSIGKRKPRLYVLRDLLNFLVGCTCI